jgi:hypothetical protein
MDAGVTFGEGGSLLPSQPQEVEAWRERGSIWDGDGERREVE